MTALALFAFLSVAIVLSCAPATAGEEPSPSGLEFVGVELDQAMPESQRGRLTYIWIDAAAGKINFFGNSTHVFKPCDSGTIFCAWGDPIKLMIPLDWSKGTGEWHFRDVRFRVIDKTFTRDGSAEEILVEGIEEGRSIPPSYYVYSISRGLLSFRVHFSGVGEVLTPIAMSRAW